MDYHGSLPALNIEWHRIIRAVVWVDAPSQVHADGDGTHAGVSNQTKVLSGQGSIGIPLTIFVDERGQEQLWCRSPRIVITVE